MTSFEEKLEEQTIAPEKADSPKHSKWETFTLALKVAGIAALVLGAIWAIEFLKG
jgi:flagellar biogenesis protein FliO